MSEKINLQQFGGDHEGKQPVQFGPIRLDVPTEWDVTTIRDVLELLTDFEANGSFSDLKENVKQYAEPNFAWYVRATDLENENHPGSGEVKYTDRESYEFLEKSSLDGGELLMSKRGQIGNVYLMPDVDMPATVAPNTYLLKLKDDSILNHYLYYYLSSHIGYRQLKRRDASTTIGAIYKEDLKDIEFPLPALEEQRKIASVLYTVDQAIQKTEAILEQTAKVKTGVMQDLFRNGVQPGPVKELRRMGQVPKQWEVVKLGTVCDKITDGTHFSPPTIEDGYPYITSKNVRDWGFDLSDLKYISKEDHEDIISRCNPEKGDVLYVKDGANTGNVYVNTLDFEFSLLSSVALIKPNRDQVESWFLKYLLSWPKFRQLVLSQMSGTGISRLTISKLEKTDILLPPIDEQRKIIEILDQFREQQSLHRKERERLKRLKRGLMQDLLSGKVRTHDKPIGVIDKVLAHG